MLPQPAGRPENGKYYIVAVYHSRSGPTKIGNYRHIELREFLHVGPYERDPIQLLVGIKVSLPKWGNNRRVLS